MTDTLQSQKIASSTSVASEHKVFPPFDSSTFLSTLIWLFISFGFLFLILKRTFLPRIAEIIEVRHDRIASQLAEAERTKSETVDILSKYSNSIKSSKEKAHSELNVALEQTKSKCAENEAVSLSELASNARESRQQLEEDVKKNQVHLKSIAATTAAIIIKKVSGSVVSNEQVDKYL